MKVTKPQKREKIKREKEKKNWDGEDYVMETQTCFERKWIINIYFY